MGLGRAKTKRARVFSNYPSVAPLFPVGAEVEVRGADADPGLAGSFYEATVTAHLSVNASAGHGGYEVRYRTLLGAEGGDLLVEKVDAADVRPRPPLPEQGGFAPLDMVEVLHNEGWWPGVVAAGPLPAPAAGNRVYRVTLPISRELLEVQETDLRPRRVYEGGRWLSVAEAERGNTLFSEKSLVEVSTFAKVFGKAWSPAKICKVLGSTTFLVQYKPVEGNGELEVVDVQYVRPIRTVSPKEKWAFSPYCHVDAFHQANWWPGIIMKKSVIKQAEKYMVKLDAEEFADPVPVEKKEYLRPRYGWVGGSNWVRYTRKKSSNEQLHLTYPKRPISAVLDSCNGGDEIRDESDSYTSNKLNANVSPEPVSPVLSVGNGNHEIKTKSSAYSEQAGKKNEVLREKSQEVYGHSVPQTPSGENFEVKNKIDMDKKNHQLNVVGLSSNGPETHHADIGSPVSANSLAAPKGGIVRQNLPFVKTNPMWAEIEAREILGKYPQQPHFREFQQYASEVHEGMALGLMSSFASLAESIDRLTVEDDNALFQQKMNSLPILELNGFHVGDLRSRLDTLLGMKNVGAELQDAM